MRGHSGWTWSGSRATRHPGKNELAYELARAGMAPFKTKCSLAHPARVRLRLLGLLRSRVLLSPAARSLILDAASPLCLPDRFGRRTLRSSCSIGTRFSGFATPTHLALACDCPRGVFLFSAPFRKQISRLTLVGFHRSLPWAVAAGTGRPRNVLWINRPRRRLMGINHRLHGPGADCGCRRRRSLPVGLRQGSFT